MSCRGFTLFEILITLAVVAVSLNLTVFSARELIDSRELAARASQLEDALLFARKLALISNKSVSVCPSSDGQSCLGDDYADGWIIFSENPADADSKRDADEIIVATQSPWSEPWFVVTRNLRRIRFLPSGNAGFSGRLFVCSTRAADRRRVIVINPNGLVRVGNDDERDECAA